MLLEKDCPPTEDTTIGETECLKAGRCVCCKDGLELRRLRNSLLRAMKRVFLAKTQQQRDLVDGFIVAHLRGKVAGNSAVEQVELDSSFKDVYLHVGMMYLRPYRPTWMEVEPVAPPSDIDPAAGELWVKAVALASLGFPTFVGQRETLSRATTRI